MPPETTDPRAQFDDKQWYCRMLGHTIAFRYCRTMTDGLPCNRILDCWYELIPIQDFIAQNYSSKEQETIRQPPQSRLDIMAQTLNRVGKEKAKDKK